jgi:transmembrane sensor
MHETRQFMEPKFENIYDLIAKSFSDDLTEQEAIQLNSWKSAERSNLLEYIDYQSIWENSGQLALPGSIDLTDSLKSTRKKAGIGRSPIKWYSYLQVAAVLVLAVMLSALYNLYIAPKAQVNTKIIVYQEVKSTYGTQSRVELSDGTIVNLNSGSSLRFPISFNNQKTRNVTLTGEGHFKVAKNSAQPFVVDVNDIHVKVLGTTFNIDAYADNSSVTIALVEGKITLQQETANGMYDLLEMKPNQVATYQQKTNKLQWRSEKDLNKYTAWTDGKIVFSNDPVATVIHKLENWYNIDIKLADKRLERYRFTGTFINEPLEQVLSIINMTSKMSYTVIPAQKLPDNSYSKRKIILKSK